MRKSILLHAILLCLVLWVKPAFSQNDIKSSLIGTPNADERAANIVADNAGNTYVGGVQDKKGLVVKQNALHQTIWMKTLAFTNNPADETIISFLDQVGDTVFGCGTVRRQANLYPFYFKLSAQTGNLYWSKCNLTTKAFFSCMRYANGRFFLVGGVLDSLNVSLGKAMAVSSQTGNLVWETPLKQGVIPGSLISGGITNVFAHATEIRNGKFYITGYSRAFQDLNLMTGTAMPLLIGINENGTVFLEKWLNISHIGNAGYFGYRIHQDLNQNLIINSARWDGIVQDDFIMTKCDTLGNVLFSNNYEIGSNSPLVFTFWESMNETATGYVFFGTRIGVMGGIGLGGAFPYVMETDKSGNVQQSILVYKPNTSSLGMASWSQSGVSNGINGIIIMTGNSRLMNGKHYFVSSEIASAANQMYDINQVILNENLDEVEDCYQLITVPTSVNIVPATTELLPMNNFPHTMSFQNGIILDDLPPFEFCMNTSLDLVQNSGCEESTISANTAGFTAPTFYWSDGTVSTGNTLTVHTEDTVIVRVLDTKCCELIDTIIPVMQHSDLTMSLPADTTVCFQSGAGGSYTLFPTILNPNSPVQYLWSNNSTGASLTVTTSGTYWVEVSDNCKTLRDSMVVQFRSIPVITNTAPLVVCEGNFPVNLNPVVSVGSTILWEDGSIFIPRSVSGPGSYTLEASNVCGTVSATIAVSQTDLPDIQLASSVDSCLLVGGSLILSPVFSGTTSVLWSNGSTTNQLSVSASGTYTVTATNACGTTSASCTVTINRLPELDLPAVLDTCFEIGVGFAYTAQGSGGSYAWSSGSQTATEWISQEGTYSCTLTNVCGSVTDSMLVSKIPLPEIQWVASIDSCISNGASITLTPVFSGTTSVLWSDGSTGNQLAVSASGTYTVTASNVCGTSTESCVVTINHFPELNLPAVLDTCFEVGVGFAYTAQGSGGSYQWSSGSQTATEWISQEGMYSCTLTNVCGSMTDSMQVHRYTEVDLFFPEDSIKDCQRQLSVSALQVETNYALEIFSPNNELVGTDLTESGWYTLHAFNPCGETWDSIYVNLQNEQFFYLPNSFTPNGDSHNERYEFQGENVEIRSMRIFNRWGEEIFSEAGNFSGWDGTYKGEICPTGMYAVSVIYEDCFGMPTEFNGHVNLLR